eukprot:1287238-Pyramimonas_sp.AAC.1
MCDAVGQPMIGPEAAARDPGCHGLEVRAWPMKFVKADSGHKQTGTVFRGRPPGNGGAPVPALVRERGIYAAMVGSRPGFSPASHAEIWPKT